ncbi:MAG: hypothetical protein J7L62_06285 [Candidatus Aminicenantes bacterium]|nr:hypothetical protein [Candidatus Aminicenantes bacterium]
MIFYIFSYCSYLDFAILLTPKYEFVQFLGAGQLSKNLALLALNIARALSEFLFSFYSEADLPPF